MAPRNAPLSTVGSTAKPRTKDYFERRGIAPYLREGKSEQQKVSSPLDARKKKNAATPSSTNLAGEADAAAGTPSSVLTRVSSLSNILIGSPTPTHPPEPAREEQHEPKDSSEAKSQVQPTWRLKERLRTAGVGLIMSLNIGTDPPDITKPHPCARLQCWMDPLSVRRAKAKEEICERLQGQYARWQPQRTNVPVKYRQAPDPTIEEVRALCLFLRRQARSERVLLHYNGHGVPRPTPSGEIWVFDKEHREYIPLHVTDLRQWLGKPSIVVLDCSSAGILIPFLTAPLESTDEQTPPTTPSPSTPPSSGAPSPLTPPSRTSSPFTGPDMEAAASQMVRDTIVLCASSEGEWLPMHPEYPADIFTSCLTTPIEIALRFFIRRNPQSMGGLNPDVVDFIPGNRGDRKTPLGELHWIFAAVADCIAWNVLPKPLFQRLFRQDHLVAGIFRNFLLADRILRTLNCTPQSYPPLPPGVHTHPLWDAWDLACETCLSGLVRDGLLGNHMLTAPGGEAAEDNTLSAEASSTERRGDQSPTKSDLAQTLPPSSLSSPFFSEQLTAFEIWVEFATVNKVNQSHFDGDDPYEPPEQLPIVLQVSLSPAHRVRALMLLRSFLELGDWAVNVALCVGILPYVMKLLQSPEYKRDLVAIWSRILLFDPSCQVDLVRDGVLHHFVNHLSFGLNNNNNTGSISDIQAFDHVYDPEDGANQRSMAAFVLAASCLGFSHGQNDCIRYNLHGTCCSLLSSTEFAKGAEELDPDFAAKMSISKQRFPPHFRMWLCICLGNLVKENGVVQGEAYNVGVHRRLFAKADDESADVRTAACYAMGCLISSSVDLPTPSESPQSTRAQLAQGPISVPGAAAVLPPGLVPNRLVNVPHQPPGVMVPGAPGTVSGRFQPAFVSGHPAGRQLQWHPQQVPVGMAAAPSFQGRPIHVQPSPSVAGPGGSGGPPFGSLSSDKKQPAAPGVFEDSNRLSLDLSVAEVLLKSTEDASPLVRYEAVVALAGAVEKYLPAFLAVADEPAASGDQTLFEAHDSDTVSELPHQRGKIPLPPQLQPDALVKFIRIWKAVRAVQRRDPHPGVSAAANAVASAINEKILCIRMELAKLEENDERGSAGDISDGIKRIRSDFQMGNVDETAPLDDDHLSRPSLSSGGPAVEYVESHGPDTIRRVSSDNRFSPKRGLHAARVGKSHSERGLTSHDVTAILSDKSRAKMDYDFPRSMFYEWKKNAFAEASNADDPNSLQLDPLSPEGAAAAYREHRNMKVTRSSMQVATHFASLAPEPPRPKRRYELFEHSEEAKRQENEELFEKKKELELKQTGLLREADSANANLLNFHPYENALVACEENGIISVWDYQELTHDLLFRNGNPKGTRMTSACWVNETSNSLFMVGCDDGSVRIWDGLLELNGRVSSSQPSLSSAFYAVPDMVVDPRSGLILEWQQYGGRLVAGGNSSYIRCWDLEAEKCSTMVETQSEAYVTSLDTAWHDEPSSQAHLPLRGSQIVGPDMIIAGQSDGMIKLFDIRSNRVSSELGAGKLSSHGRPSRLMRYDEHKDWIVGATCTSYGGRYEIVSGSIDGVIKVWDLRVSASMRTYNVQRSAMTTFAVHPRIPMLATGSHAQFIKTVALDGDTIQTIIDDRRYSHRIGPVSRLAFHPHKLLLAAADKATVISIFSPKNPTN